ncbi:MAG: AAA family ATPase [Promethearchaeota archaeon]
MDDLGGLDTLKEWLTLRRLAFREDARQFGLPAPKGVLLIGVPGTGKSATCDALSHAYEMPLLRLDFGAVFSAHVGESEANIRLCLQTAEAISPAILWIDEVEKGIGGVESSNATDGGVTNRVFGTLLTWMQDKLAPVFVVCTANNVLGMPPEFMRAGRFDEIFFIDLPNDDQRYEVAEKLLRRKGRNPDDFDIDPIVSASHHYSPAEIEKGIDNALFVAYSENKRSVLTEDVVSEIKKFHPLYNSRREEIDAMREWAIGGDGLGGRAVLANSPEKKAVPVQDAPRALDLDL